MESVALVAGESLVDVVRGGDGSTRERPGGSAANVAVALARLDRPVWFATSYADDEHGGLVADHLRASGVELAGDPFVVDRTSVATATIDATGAASYDFAVDWRLADTIQVPARLAVGVVHVGSYAAVRPPGARQAEALVRDLRARAIVSYDVNARPQLTGVGADVVATVERLVALADVVKASDEDLAALYPGQRESDVVARLLASGPAAVVVTRGAEGATAVTEHGIVDVVAVRGDVDDTIGAGDTFSAAIIDALWERDLLGAAARDRLRDLEPEGWCAVLEHAAAAAAVTVSRPGADPPHRHDLPG